MVAIFGKNAIGNTSLELELVDKFQLIFRKNYPMFALTAGISMLVISTFAVSANIAVITSFIRDPLKILRASPTSILVFSLACTDFVIALLICPITGVGLLYVSQDEQIPFSFSVVLIYSVIMKILAASTLSVLSVDRMIAVLKPLQYKTIVTVKRTIISVTAIWIYTVLVGTITAILYQTVGVVPVLLKTLCHIALTSLILKLSSIALLWSIHKQSLKMKKLYSPDCPQNKRAVHRERKVAKAIRIIVVIFHLCFLPWCICIIIFFTCFGCNINVPLFFKAVIIADILNYSSSLIHPFLYAYGLPKFKKTLKHLVKKDT